MSCAQPLRSKSFQAAVCLSGKTVNRNYTSRSLNVCRHVTKTNKSRNFITSKSQARRAFRSSAVNQKRDFYAVLGVNKSASTDEIKSKYREMAKKCHPDLNKDDKNAGTKFRELSEAYEVLQDDGKRQMYDNYGHAGVDQNMGGGGQQQQRGNPFGGGFGGFGGGFGGFQGGGSVNDIFDMMNQAMEREQREVGKDVKVKLTLSFLEAVTGCNKDIKYEYVLVGMDKKRTQRSKNVSVDIPPGVESGMTVKMAGQGCEAQSGRHVGDLFIELQVQNDPYFKRENSDVYTDLHISMAQVRIRVVSVLGLGLGLGIHRSVHHHRPG
jgi:DnaJ-class molecular chaperone